MGVFCFRGMKIRSDSLHTLLFACPQLIHKLTLNFWIVTFKTTFVW